MKSYISNGEKCDDQGFFWGTHVTHVICVPLMRLLNIPVHERNTKANFVKSPLNMFSETETSEFQIQS